ncbi:uncharacterized protein LOC108258609 isoform X1 [Tachysurus ichikawai]
MAVLYNRVRRLNVLKVSRSFVIIRRTPGIATLSTRAANPKKLIRYTSIKKAKPKTITDIGNLLLQKASKAKEIQQLVIGDVFFESCLTECVEDHGYDLTYHISSGSKKKESAVQEVALEEVAVFSSQPKIMDALTEKSLDVKPETVFESNIIWGNKSLMGSDPARGELAEDEVRAEEERSVQDVSDAQLDRTIQKLFLDKIREFSCRERVCTATDLLSFPEFKFLEPVLDENNSK